jgi:hypothetical protein
MKSISDTIEEAAVKFETTTGQKPTSIYLGWDEFDAFSEFVYDAAGITISDHHDSRCEYRGRKVFRVNESSWLQCGI